MNIAADGKWHRFRLRHPQLQILEVRHSLMHNGHTREDIVLYSPPLEILDLGVERNYPYRR
jgi:hypothetical protein